MVSLTWLPSPDDSIVSTRIKRPMAWRVGVRYMRAHARIAASNGVVHPLR
jgi:hypothetical protein